MNIIDRVRIEYAVARYDFWLETREVYRRRRRELRRDLRDNLTEAARHEGAGRAIDNLGSIRALAHESAPPTARSPHWVSGLYAAFATLVLLLGSAAVMAVAFVDGVAASGATREVSGDLTLMPWVTVTAQHTDSTLSVGMGTGTWPLVAPVVVFLLASRPWRLLRTSGVPGRSRVDA